ncbi:MAG: hypothetical protein JXQ71_15925 [Verrucomicrobia bacterium]|nr:hypothetical protein [Verrucomicrobiota bacterium]
MKPLLIAAAIALSLATVPAQVRIGSWSATGLMAVTHAFTNGVVGIDWANDPAGPWVPARNVFSTAAVAQAGVALPNTTAFYRAWASDLSGGRTGFTNLTCAYGLLSALAGAGAPQEQINWRPEFEGAPATNVLLSSPHITLGDRAGNYFIADKDAHGIRKVRPDGTIVTVAGVNLPGDGPDGQTNGTACALNGPNGLWLRTDGTVYLLDLNNSKVRRLDTNGLIQTLFAIPGGLFGGRGLWVSEDETLAYVSSWATVKQWTATNGVTDFSTGYTELGNLGMDPRGNLVVTDRGAHRVYRLDAGGHRTAIAGNGMSSGGGDGQPALATGLEGVRGVWFLPSGAYFLCTHRGSQVWYVDTDGFIHLFLNGHRSETHAGDGTWFYNPAEYRVSECRAVTVDAEGNVVVTENDYGFVRRVRFLPFAP